MAFVSLIRADFFPGTALDFAAAGAAFLGDSVLDATGAFLEGDVFDGFVAERAEDRFAEVFFLVMAIN